MNRIAFAIIFLIAFHDDRNGYAVVYEGFDYNVGSLAGNNGGDGFAGAWTDNEFQPATVLADSLSFPGITTSGGAARLTGSLNTRSLTLITPANGETTWISYLFTSTSLSIAPDALATFYTGPNSGGQRPTFGIFNSGGTFYFGIGSNTLGLVLSDTVFNLGETYLVRASIEWNTALVNPETIRLFVNSADDGDTLGSPVATRSDINIETNQSASGTSRLDRIGIEAGGANWVFDEIHIVPEPTSITLALAAAGILALGRLRRSRRG